LVSGRRLVVLLGQGISYSASPAMHSAAFASAGLDWSYELRDVSAEGLPAAVAALRTPAYGGANVTIPHKVAVIPLLDGLDAPAAATGAVNTIRLDGSRLLGSNTDVAGIRAALGEVGIDPAGASAVVLGAGGSARAAGTALRGARLSFVTRRPGAAAELPGQVLSWDDPSWWRLVRGADLLLNATPLGRQQELPLPVDELPLSGAVVDLVYSAAGTPLVRAARDRGLRWADGWTVLVAQGAAAFEAWTGRPAPIEAMRAALPL
jgi:shikimate dehydrogenase